MRYDEDKETYFYFKYNFFALQWEESYDKIFFL